MTGSDGVDAYLARRQFLSIPRHEQRKARDVLSLHFGVNVVVDRVGGLGKGMGKYE
jgi:hypothetical protein